MSLYQLHNKPETLYGWDRHLQVPSIAYEEVLNTYESNEDRNPELEQVIARDPYYAYVYAVGILRKRWPEGEPAIATSPEFAYQYARERNRTWKDMGKEEVEFVIAQHPMYAYYYARWVLESRWPEAEPYIKQDPVWWEEYVTRFKNQF